MVKYKCNPIEYIKSRGFCVICPQKGAVLTDKYCLWLYSVGLLRPSLFVLKKLYGKQQTKMYNILPSI